MRIVSRAAVLLCAMLLGSHVAIWAGEDLVKSAPRPSVPPFHRTFIPAEAVQNRDWKRGYLPMDAKEFERLLDVIDAAAAGAPGASGAHVESAQYSAQLVGDDLLVGTGVLQLNRRTDAPTTLALEPWNLALATATWQDQNGRVAVMGAGPDGRLRMRVEGSQLSCTWSLRGERTASGAVAFRLELPGCPVTRLAVDAPAGLEVIADQGIVARSAGPGAQTSRWTIELGGHCSLSLRVVPEDVSRQRRQLTLLRQAVTYEVSPRGINAIAQLKLDVHGEPLQRIAVDLDPDLRLLAARYGELEIPWSATADVETGISHAVLQFPEPIVGTGRVLNLRAMAPLVSGKVWRLPALRPQGMSWQEGTAELLIPNAFTLEQLVTDGCRQSRISALPAPLAGESIEIQYYRSGGTIDVLVAPSRERLKLDSGTLVEVGTGEITSVAAVQLGLALGQRRAVQFDVYPGWIIDAVEHQETNRPANWELEESSSERNVLKVRLEDPITSGSPRRLLIRGHRPLPGEGAFDARQLEMLSFDTLQRGTSLICVRAGEGSELRWTGSEDLSRLDPLKLSPDEVTLFAQPPSGLVFSQDAAFAQAAVALLRRKPSYTASILIDAAVQKNVLTETYTIGCAPEAARVERLLVHLSDRRDAPLEWSLAGGTSGQFSARRISAAEQAQVALPPGGEAWELNLQLVRPGAFELRGTRSVPFTAEMPIALASVADAATQRGRLAIRALGNAGLSIKNRRLKPVPAELLDADRFQTARATYHFQPARDDLGPEPAVSIAPAPPAQAESGAWVWNNQLDSRYSPDGSSVHWATFQIQSAGQQRLHLSLVADAKFQSVRLDGQKLSLEAASLSEGQTVIELPSGRSFATLEVYFTTPGGLPSLVTSHAPPFPTLDIPIMARGWSVWLPPGYAILDADDRFPSDALQPLTWSQRLFGVLGRGAGQKLFNPLATADWRSTFGTAETQATRQAADAFAQNLGKIEADYASREELTWGQLLSLCAEAEAPSRRTLLVDADSLAWLGITSQTRIRFQSGDTDRQRGHAMLKQTGLALMADAAAIVVTSASNAASYAGQLSPPDAGVVHTVAAGPLADEVRRAAGRGDWSRFQSIETWRAAPERRQSFGLPLALTSSNVNEAQGWSAYSLRFSEASAPSVRIVHTPAMSSLAWAVFLAIVGLGLWAPKGRLIALTVLLSTSAFAALLLPAAYAPLASAALLAGSFCAAVRMTRIPLPRVRSSDPSQGSRKLRSSVARELARLLFVAAILNLAWAVSASQPAKTRPNAQGGNEANPATATPSAPLAASTDEPRRAENDGAKHAGANDRNEEPAPVPIHRVFIPTDETQKPVGGMYYVPEELYRQLHQQAERVSDEPKDWLVTRGVYHGTLVRDPVNHRLGLTQLNARFDLHVFQSDVQVKLPLPREAMAKVILGARLEGRPIPIAWNAEGDALVVGPLAADRYRLELDLQPALQGDATATEFDVAIPPLANATLELTFPPDTPTIELPTARGQVRLQSARGELSAQLGPVDRLVVRWPMLNGPEAIAPNLEVEELIWVKVRPGTTVLDAKFKYRVLAGRIRQIRLHADPRLRILPTTGPESPVAAVHPIPGDPQKIDLELSRPVSDQVVIDLSFLLTNTSGVGNLRLPRLETSGARAARRWLGVSVDAALQPKIQAGEDSRTLNIPDFTAAWGAAEARPQAAYSIPRGEPVWVLATQPNEPRTSLEQLLSLSLGRSSSLVRFDANLTIAGGHLLQFNLQGPSGLIVEQISVLEDELQRVARWTVDERGRITVFLNAPVDGRQRLLLRGRWDAMPDKAFAAPQIDVLGAETKKRQLHLYRQPAVLAAVKRTPLVSEIEADDDEPLDGFGALVGRYMLEDPKAIVTITLAPNVAKSRAVATTYLQRDANRWVADLHYHLEVTEGLVDSPQFEVPPQWSEPYRIEPPTPFKILPIPGEQRRQLIVYPEPAIKGKYELKIRGRVALSAGDRLRAPDILPLRSQQIERFVVLPQHLDAQQISWDIVGLSRATLPEGFVAAGPHAQSDAVYQVAGDRFQASLKAVEPATAAAQVALADIHVVWQNDGSCEGVANFDLEPGGAASCVLELPSGCRLLHVSIESSPALMVALDANRWRVTLESQQLPQRVEVIYTCPLEGSSHHKQFRAPRLADLEVARTLWTVHGPPGFGRGQPPQSKLATSPAAQELERLKTINTLVQLPAEVTAEHLPEEIVRWYRPWKERYSASRAAFAWQLSAAGQNNPQSEENIAARDLDKQILAVDARLGATSPPSRQVTLAPPPTELLAAARANLLPTHYMVRGNLYDLDLYYPQAPSTGLWPRLLFALAILLAGGVVVVRFAGRELPVFSPAAAIGGLGLAWWLILAPSFFGLAAILVTAWIALRTRWQGSVRSQTS
jgi:hypothetical protein